MISIGKATITPAAGLAVLLVAVIVVMVLPLPAFLLDLGLAASFSLAILILTVTLFVDRPLDFTAFPAALLITLLLRLSLTVASTKLIISQGHTGVDAAGKVIEGFATFVMGGSVLLGAVVFCVIMIVNFMVITKGAARMAEVGARFVLDAMPGRQMAIDADLASGAIDHAQARQRREQEQVEATFFGSLDGASKFVKGDAVASLLITLLNFIVGLAAGCLLQGMPIGEALKTYTVLTVGDGLVTQIPAVIVSVATALLLSRGGQQGKTDRILRDQIGRLPGPLMAAAAVMGVLALVPGLPLFPFLSAAALCGGGAWIVWQRGQRAPAPAALETPQATAKTLGDMMDLDDIHIEFAPDLVEMVLAPASGLDARIVALRQHVATYFGVLLPEIRLTDNSSFEPGSYAIMVQGVEQARAVLRPGQMLALLGSAEGYVPQGEDVKEPVYGAPARWIEAEDHAEAALQGLTTVQPAEVLATHLMEVVKRNFPRLLTYRALRRRLEEMVNVSDRTRSEALRRFVDEMIPDKVPIDLLLAVLRLLLEERVSIRNLPLIIESLAEARGGGLNVEDATELVRQRLGFQLVAELRRADGAIPLVQLAPEWEEVFLQYQIGTDPTLPDVALPPEDFTRLTNALASQFSAVAQEEATVALVTSSRRRRFLRNLMVAKGLHHPVVSFEEIGLDARPALVGMVAA